MPITFAVVKKTSAFIDVNRSQDQIKEDIEDMIDDEDYVEFYTMNNHTDLLQCISDHVTPSSNLVTGTKTYISGKLYQSIFDALPNTVDQSNAKINKLGSQFTDGILTENPVMIIKNNIISDTEVELISISKHEVITLLKDKFIKNGIVYKPNGECDVYSYTQNHLDNLMYKFGQDYVLNNFQYDEMEIGDMVFIIASNKTETTENSVMSKIVGKPVKGDVFCSLYTKSDHIKDSTYISLDKNTFNKIIYLLQEKDFDPTDDNQFENMTKDNAERIADSHNSQLVISPFTIIDRMYKKYNK